MLETSPLIAFIGGQYQCYVEKEIKYYKVGELFTNICNIDLLQISSLLNKSPFLNEVPDKNNRIEAVDWFRNQINTIIEPFTLRFFMHEFNSILEKMTFFKPKEFLEMGIYKNDLTVDSFKNCGELLSYVLEETSFSISVAREFADALIDSNNDKIEVLYSCYNRNQNIEFKIYYDKGGKFTNVYTIGNIVSLICFEVSNMVQLDQVIKRCPNCLKYFVPANRADITIYCDRTSPQDCSKTCKEYGALKQYQDSLREDEAKGLYRKLYMAKQMLKKRNPEIENYQLKFEEFKADAKQWKNDVKSGTKTQEEYLEWLKDIKNQGNY